MLDIAGDIENRPKELWDLPNYGCLPDQPFEIDLEGAAGEFQHFTRLTIGQAVDTGNAVSQADHGTCITRFGYGFEIRNTLLNEVRNFGTVELHTFSSVSFSRWRQMRRRVCIKWGLSLTGLVTYLVTYKLLHASQRGAQ